ncbi:hypothetical protein [Streptomyces sp. NPDC050485]|uniref:hypothetical protein n=1 Tax=Streptomyces sp. NPDC050485 TaxID=3365617 RepID=UPI0037BB87B7
MALSTDEVTGRTVGWEPIEQSSFAKFHAEAVENCGPQPGTTGTFELIGPKINAEHADEHFLVEHAFARHVDVPQLTFGCILDAVLALATACNCEGIVFHHDDGRRAKIKARDFAPSL